MGFRVLATGFALVLGGCDAPSGPPPPPECELACPPGTKLLNFNETNIAEGVNSGAFVVMSATCETTCAPITPCDRPNVPVVTQGEYSCQGLPGLSDLGDPNETDFSWMSVWDSQAVQP